MSLMLLRSHLIASAGYLAAATARASRIEHPWFKASITALSWSVSLGVRSPMISAARAKYALIIASIFSSLYRTPGPPGHGQRRQRLAFRRNVHRRPGTWVDFLS